MPFSSFGLFARFSRLFSKLYNRRVAHRFSFPLNLFYLKRDNTRFKIDQVSYSGLLISKEEQAVEYFQSKSDVTAQLCFFNLTQDCLMHYVGLRPQGLAFRFIHADDSLLHFLRRLLEPIMVGQGLKADSGTLQSGSETIFESEGRLRLICKPSITGSPSLVRMEFGVGCHNVIDFGQEPVGLHLAKGEKPNRQQLLYAAICYLVGAWETNLIPHLEVQISHLFQDLIPEDAEPELTV